MGDAYTPFSLSQVIPVQNPDGTVGWEFLGGVSLPAPAQTQYPPNTSRSVKWTRSSDGAYVASHDASDEGINGDLRSSASFDRETVAPANHTGQFGNSAEIEKGVYDDGGTPVMRFQLGLTNNGYGGLAGGSDYVKLIHRIGPDKFLYAAGISGGTDAKPYSDWAWKANAQLVRAWNNTGMTTAVAFNTNGGPCLIYTQGTGYVGSPGKVAPTWESFINGASIGTADYYWNVASQHLLMPPLITIITTLAAGAHSIGSGTHVSWDGNDTWWGFIIELGNA